MNTILRVFLPIGALAALGSGCGGDHMSMADDVDRLVSHQNELASELDDHHRTVLDTNDLSRIFAVEQSFGPSSLGHMDEMEHRLRDMHAMCTMGGRGFDPGQMPDTMGRARTALEDHKRRMAAAGDLGSSRAEEGAFRDMVAGMMKEMRDRTADMRSVAMHYSCRMHGH